MIADPLLDALAGQVADRPVRRVVIGLNWTLVETAEGCGLAHTPERGAPGCRAPDGAGTLAGRGLRALAGLVRSDNPALVAVGVAAVNAGHAGSAPAGTATNGLDLFRPIAGRTVVVGRFPGLADRLPGCALVERDPRSGEVAEADAAEPIAGAAGLIITASALANGGVSRCLALAAGRADLTVALVGPGTPLAPALFRRGIHILSGTVVTDPDAAARIIGEGGAVKALAACTRPVTLTAPGAMLPG